MKTKINQDTTLSDIVNAGADPFLLFRAVSDLIGEPANEEPTPEDEGLAKHVGRIQSKRVKGKGGA